MNPLSLLSSLLDQATSASPVALRQGTEIDEELARLEQHGKTGGRAYEPRDLQVEAVRRFWEDSRLPSLRDARLVSFGLGVNAWGDNRCLMEEPRLFKLALKEIDEWGGVPRQYRKCYQGLVRSYFDYDGLGRTVPEVGKQNWGLLRKYLTLRVPQITDGGTNPEWATCATSNAELFSEKPCASLAKHLEAGNSEQVKHVRELLQIADASWFTRELVIAQIEQATKLGNPAFQHAVSSLLKMLAGNEVLRDRGLQLILDRYVSIPQTPQHPGLKEASVNGWGNPWLPSNKDRWGGISDEARDMVSDWLKLEFIELFFSKLADDGIGEPRRVDFWRKYVKSMDNIHFALGTTAMYSNEKDFKEIRKKLKGLLVALEDASGSNNAFIMTMGDLVAVEFSGASNAFYGYSAKRKLPFDRTQPVRTPVDGRNSLKNSERALYLRHQDNALGYDYWEDRFEDELRKHQIHPGKAAPRRVAPQTPAPTPTAAASPPPATTSPRSDVFNKDNLNALVRRMGASVADHTGNGGALWVLADDNGAEARRLLTLWGFTFKAGKGWHRKPPQ